MKMQQQQQQQQQQLLKNYHDASKDYSFASAKNVYNNFNNNNNNNNNNGGGGGGGKKVLVDKTLMHSTLATTFKQHRKPRHSRHQVAGGGGGGGGGATVSGPGNYMPVYVHRRRELFQADCIHMLANPQLNAGYKYLLCIIDCWTKFAWVYPLKSLKCASIVARLRQLFSHPDRIPEKFGTDGGPGKRERERER